MQGHKGQATDFSSCTRFLYTPPTSAQPPVLSIAGHTVAQPPHPSAHQAWQPAKLYPLSICSSQDSLAEPRQSTYLGLGSLKPSSLQQYSDHDFMALQVFLWSCAWKPRERPLRSLRP